MASPMASQSNFTKIRPGKPGFNLPNDYNIALDFTKGWSNLSKHYAPFYPNSVHVCMSCFMCPTNPNTHRSLACCANHCAHWSGSVASIMVFRNHHVSFYASYSILEMYCHARWWHKVRAGIPRLTSSPAISFIQLTCFGEDTVPDDQPVQWNTWTKITSKGTTQLHAQWSWKLS